MGSAITHCVALLLVSKATSLSGSAFPITLRLRLVFLDAYHMGSANAYCVTAFLVSKATASTCAVIGNMSTGWTSCSS